MKKIRIVNLLGLSLCILFFVPYYVNIWLYTNNYWSIAIFGVYLFIFFSFWFFLFFLFSEIRYVLKNKLNFFEHVINNKLVFWGIIPLIIYLILWFTHSS